MIIQCLNSFPHWRAMLNNSGNHRIPSGHDRNFFQSHIHKNIFVVILCYLKWVLIRSSLTWTSALISILGQQSYPYGISLLIETLTTSSIRKPSQQKQSEQVQYQIVCLFCVRVCIWLSMLASFFDIIFVMLLNRGGILHRLLLFSSFPYNFERVQS